MLEVTLLALLVSIITCGVHYKQHFEGKCCRKIGKRRRNVSTTAPVPDCLSHSLCFGNIFQLTTASREKLDFFPLSCMYYLIFTTLLTGVIVTIEIMYAFTYNLDYHETHLFIFTLNTNSQYYFDNSVTSLTKSTLIHAFDFIAIYGVMLLSLWESLHSFYRYYTTYTSVFKLRICRPKHVLKLFSIYAFFYVTSYVITIHQFYWAFPIPISIHLLFNLYCNLTFSRILYQKYKAFANGTNRRSLKSNAILQSVRHMQISSNICCVLQTIYLVAFLATYNVTTILFLPILWSLCAVLFCSEFVRNRQTMHHFFSVICKCCVCVSESRDEQNEMLAKYELEQRAANASTENKNEVKRNSDNTIHSKQLQSGTKQKSLKEFPKSAPIDNRDFEKRYSFVAISHQKLQIENLNSLNSDNDLPKLQHHATAPNPQILMINSNYEKLMDAKSPESHSDPMVTSKERKTNGKIIFEANRMKDAMCTLNTWTKHGFCDRINYDEMRTINTPEVAAETECISAFPKTHSFRSQKKEGKFVL